MDSRAPQAAAQPPSGRKSKAPPPPSGTKPVAVSPFDDSSASLIMEQKENVIDKDIELPVVLPGDVIKYTTVNGRKPMMDLLIFLCAQYHLNPSSYTIELVSAENNQIKFKPNTPVGMLEVEKVILKPKEMDKKKPAPVIPEQTVRVVINYKKAQKTVVRVSPHAPLQELIPIVCSKCDFDPSHTLLLKNYQSQEPLDMTKSLNDLGLRELYAMDISRDSYQSENIDVLKEKESKGFFSFFQRSKKKREQAASAPATPLMSKPRPTFITRSNTVSKQYDSSTLPSEMPKKRRAPLPPMPNSQRAPQELAQAQVTPASDLVKSNSFDRSEQAPPGLVRKGSLLLSDTASVNSSLRRTKRKAPSPPSRAPEDQSESSNETVTASPESAPTKVEERATEMESKTGVRSTEHNLEEIDEREEMSVQQGEDSESTNTSLGTGEVTAAFSSAEVPLETEKNDPASPVPVPGRVSVDNLQSFEEEKQENMSTDGKGLQTKISSEQAAFEKDRKLRILHQNKANDHSDTKLLSTTEEGEELQTAEIKTVDFRENNKLEVDRLSNCQACKNDISVSHKNYPQLIPEKEVQKSNQTSLDTVKTQDIAIQAGPSDSGLGRTTQKKITVPQACDSSMFQGLVPQHNTDTNNPLLQVMHRIQKDEDTPIEQNLERREVAYDKVISLKDQSHISINGSNFASPETTVKTPGDSPVKGYPVYRQDTKPKPKPSNEITRDYIPKIGMTTYKIVPPKSLEIMKSWESEIPSDHKDQEVSTSENSGKHEDLKEFIVQAEIPHLPKSVGHLRIGSQNEPPVTNDQLHRVNSFSQHVTSGAEVTTETKRTETESSKQCVPLTLSLDSDNAASETQDKSNALSPTTKPSSFYLQMQRRASGHYVTSAIARSNICTPNSIQNEAKNADVEKKISSSDPISLSLHKTSTTPFPADETKVDEKNTESSTSPVTSNNTSSFASCPTAPLNIRTLRTLAVPKPYSSSRPSPFALAVSSAVKRSQSFNKTRTIATSQAPREEFPVEFSSAASATEFSSATSVPEVKTPSSQSIAGGSQNNLMDKKGSNVNSEQKSQAQSGASTDHPPPVTKRQTVMSFQRSDPEQIHQSLLAAIRSGEAAAKLKRVGPPSHTISVNGRARLTPLYSTEAKANH